MKNSILSKLEVLQARYIELEKLLSNPKIISDQKRFRNLSREYSQLMNITRCFNSWKETQKEIKNAKSMLEDPEIKSIAEEELEKSLKKNAILKRQLHMFLLPKDPNDERSCFIEIRAGTGGSEAGLFANDLFRMYTRYAEVRRWKSEIISAHDSEHGGYKEIITRITGNGAYGHLKFESGGHRVQRVPETESQGRIHTSTCTVAVMPEIPETEIPVINPGDLKIDSFRSSGAGGQHVNTTDSAIRITHLPTGIVVECQDERSQHKNKAKALTVLNSRIHAAEIMKRQTNEANTRRNLLGSGDRSDRIRTYNFPHGRITDHRIQLTIYSLNEIMNGKLDSLIYPIVQEYQTDQLTILNTQE